MCNRNKKVNEQPLKSISPVSNDHIKCYITPGIPEEPAHHSLEISEEPAPSQPWDLRGANESSLSPHAEEGQDLLGAEEPQERGGSVLRPPKLAPCAAERAGPQAAPIWTAAPGGGARTALGAEEPCNFPDFWCQRLTVLLQWSGLNARALGTWHTEDGKGLFQVCSSQVDNVLTSFICNVSC
ncbi:hypothetical protein CYMTET_45517 [Cymbomonas tetramitiformis]|uniref:Uncharacterized protein n=1 Tax=Cymbomonas tetramitiformis TaxID=36881 RepID=A0AAE0BZ80_9CHLO|nr:hypothetical protein CYMTET_45517 [Cymbomonas tetramitiformis]